MAMARQHTRLAHSQKIHPVTTAGREAKRTKPHILHLRDPKTFILWYRVWDDQFGMAFFRLWVTVGNPGLRDSGYGAHGLLLLIYCLYCGVSAVDRQNDSSDEAGRLGTKEDRGAGNIFRRAPALHGCPVEDGGGSIFILGKPLGKAGGDPSWRDGIDPDSFWSPGDGECLGELRYASLGGSIGRNSRTAKKREHGSGV